MFRVYGTYSDSADASRTVDILLDRGYSRKQIRVVSRNNLDKNYNLRIGEPKQDDESLWDKIKDAFTFDEYEDDFFEKDLDEDKIDFDRSLLSEYKARLDAGATIILVEESELLDETYGKSQRQDAGMGEIIEPHREDININDPNRVPLKDQDLPNTDEFKK